MKKTLLPVLLVVLIGTIVFTVLRGTPQTQPETAETEITSLIAESVQDQDFERPSDKYPGEAYSERDCLQDEIPGEIDENFLIGKAFVNYERDGERGAFHPDGVLLTSWTNPETETEYTDNEAMWGIADYELSIRHSNATDGVYGGFRFYSFEGNTFAVPADERWIFIGPDYETIDQFFNAKYMLEVCRE